MSLPSRCWSGAKRGTAVANLRSLAEKAGSTWWHLSLLQILLNDRWHPSDSAEPEEDIETPTSLVALGSKGSNALTTSIGGSCTIVEGLLAWIPL